MEEKLVWREYVTIVASRANNASILVSFSPQKGTMYNGVSMPFKSPHPLIVQYGIN